MTTNVIGPIDKHTWNALRSLKSDVSIMKMNNGLGTYTEGIKREIEIFNNILGGCVGARKL